MYSTSNIIRVLVYLLVCLLVSIKRENKNMCTHVKSTHTHGTPIAYPLGNDTPCHHRICPPTTFMKNFLITSIFSINICNFYKDFTYKFVNYILSNVIVTFLNSYHYYTSIFSNNLDNIISLRGNSIRRWNIRGDVQRSPRFHRRFFEKGQEDKPRQRPEQQSRPEIREKSWRRTRAQPHLALFRTQQINCL